MIPDVVLRTAEAQRGVIARWQLLPMMGEDAADHLLRAAIVEHAAPWSRGVYRIRGGARLPEQDAFAAALLARPRAVVTGPVALGLYGVTGFTDLALFEVLTWPDRRLTTRAFPHRRDPMPRRPTADFGAVRVAAPLDALIASAAFADRVGDRAIRVAWDQLRWDGRLRTPQLAPRVKELGATLGARESRRILGGDAGITVESEGERRLQPLLFRFDPRPEAQVWVGNRRLDFLFRSVRFGYEYLGDVDHGHAAARLADSERTDELARSGIRVGYVTRRDLDDESAFLATVAGSLAVRAHELGVRPPILLPAPAGSRA